MYQYHSILKKLGHAQVSYLAIGTWALKCAYPKIMAGYPLADCDLIIKNDLPQIRACIQVLKKAAWTVQVWEEDIDQKVTAHFLKDKYYLRAKKGALTLDLTYECPFFSWEDLYGQRVEKEGFCLGSLDHILALKRAKGSAKDLETIALFKDIAFRKMIECGGEAHKKEGADLA